MRVLPINESTSSLVMTPVISAKYLPEVNVNFDGAGMPSPRKPMVVPVISSPPENVSPLGMTAEYEIT